MSCFSEFIYTYELKLHLNTIVMVKLLQSAVCNIHNQLVFSTV